MLNRCLLLALCLGISMPWASAQQYPTKPVRLIVPLSAGGSLDSVARIVATRLSESLGQPVVVDNRGGGGGSIGAEITARAAPDGYTIMMASSSYMILTLMYKAPYDPVRDFTPITQAASVPLLFVINPALAANNLGEFVALARARPGTLNYGSSGNGSFIHLTGELFKSMTGTRIVGIYYKGAARAATAVASGETQMMFSSVASIMPHIKSGRVKALAVTSARPSALAAGLPTLAASGLPGFELVRTDAVYVPAITPVAIVNRLIAEIVRFLSTKDAQEKFLTLEADVIANSPQEHLDSLNSRITILGKLIKDAGIKID